MQENEQKEAIREPKNGEDKKQKDRVSKHSLGALGIEPDYDADDVSEQMNGTL